MRETAVFPLLNGRISTSDLKSDVTVVFLDPDFLKDLRRFFLHGYSGPAGLKWRFSGQNGESVGAMLTFQ